MKVDFATVARLLREANSFLIASHQGPDGDAIGSMLALGHLLDALGKRVIHFRCEDSVPQIYQWLSGAERISSDLQSVPVDLAIIMDVSQKSRLGKIVSTIPPTTNVLTIDHHLDEHPDGDYVLANPTASATGELVADLFSHMDVAYSRDAAEALYVAIATDTGGFRFANTSPHCLRIAADLVQAKIDVAGISSRIFETIALPKFELLRRALQRMQRQLDGQVAYTILTAKDALEANARSEDYDGLINYARNLEGVELGILFRELDANSAKVSMRSRGRFNCAEFLREFGGGGHAAAGGATVSLPLDAVCKQVLDRITQFPPFNDDNSEG